MTHAFCRLFLLAILATAPLFTAAASGRQAEPASERLALEITYFKGRAPAFQPVPPAGPRLEGAWFGMFGRVAGWQAPAGSLPVQAVRILSRVEGEAVRIRVTVFTGARYFENEEPVGSYLVGLNDSMTVAELANFGVVPFKIKVVRVAPVATDLPRVVNNTSSIAVVHLSPNASTLPSFTLSLRNQSNKSVIALRVYVNAENRVRRVSLPRGTEGNPLIAPGADYKLNVLAASSAEAAPGGYVPGSPTGQEIRIAAVVFEDWSYEGDLEAAATVRAFRMGDKIQVSRIARAIRETLNDTASQGTEALERLKTRISALSTDVDKAAADELLAQFPGLDAQMKENIKDAVGVSLNGAKVDFLKRVRDFQNSAESADASSLRTWLTENKTRYDAWLARL